MGWLMHYCPSSMSENPDMDAPIFGLGNEWNDGSGTDSRIGSGWATIEEVAI
jgi:hypothetical protein